ncbi:MAG: hypothetical protein Tsb0013_20530 [Phycisphaerales bacterium]
MNWLVFALMMWVMMGCDLGLRSLLALGSSSISPRFALVLLVFVCLHAPPGAMMLASVAIGLVMDIVSVTPMAETSAPLVVIGPYTLGCMLAAYAILTVRSVMQRKSPFTMAALALVATVLVEVVRLTLLTVRSFYDGLALEEAATSLGTSLGIAAYTAVLAFALTPVLGALRRALRFHGSSGMGFVIHS